MKTIIHTYLTFSGTCREAMTFYKTIIGGALQLQTIGESPMADKMPLQMKENILHSTLTKGDLVIMGSDMISEDGLKIGNNVSLALNCSSEQEILSFYAKLAVGGVANHPLENTFWGAIFGDLTDKYGNHWILNYTRDSVRA